MASHFWFHFACLVRCSCLHTSSFPRQAYLWQEHYCPKIFADPNKSRTIIRDEGKSVAVRVGEVATAKDKLLLERHEMMEQGFESSSPFVRDVFEEEAAIPLAVWYAAYLP